MKKGILLRGKHKVERIVGRFLGYDFFLKKKYKSSLELTFVGDQIGGWVLPVALINQKSICYCGGCGDNISFDLSLIKLKQCSIFGFDPTPNVAELLTPLIINNPNYTLLQIGLWDKKEVVKFYEPQNMTHTAFSALNLQNTNNYVELNCDSVSNIASQLGHSKIDLLKIDIEGAEYKVIDSIIKDGPQPSIFCVEFDEYFSPIDAEARSRIIHYVDKIISSNYSLVHSERNGNYTFVKNF